MKNTSLYLTILFCFFFTTLQASYAPPHFFDMVGASDFIFLGEIQEVRESTFVLKIDEVLAGTYDSKTIEIQQFKDWTCAMRWAPYQVGQRVIAFVRAVEESKHPVPFALRSAGDEGEFPVIGEYVHYNGYPGVENVPYEDFEEGRVQKVLLAEMLSAIREYSSCFRVITPKYGNGRITAIEKVGTEEQIQEYAKKSLVHQFLINNTLEYSKTNTLPLTYTLPSGLKYKVLREGNGEKPTITQSVMVHYEGRFADGKVFDSSYQRKQPITFPVHGVIKGWVEALQLMSEGAHWQLTIPSHLAYGEKGIPGVIPSNATLIFDVELLEVK